MRNSPPLQKPILRWKQVWNYWEQLRCVAHSPLIVGFTIGLLITLQMCFDRKKSVPLFLACTKRLFNLSAGTTINAAMRVSVPGAQYCFWGSIKILLTYRLARLFRFFKKVQNHSKMLLEMCIVLECIVSTERNANLLTVM